VGVLEGASFKGAIDMEPDASAIERRFREKTGTESPKSAEDKSDVNAKSSKTAKGETDAQEAEEKGNSDKNSTTGSEQRH
jgi:hypothetical protein